MRLSAATYQFLLTVLRNNGLAAVGNDEVISIVPVEEVRQHALPAGDDALAEEWVTRVIMIDHVSAATLIPILRPLMPASGHLAVHPEANAVVIADRHANAERMERLMRQLDAAAAQTS